MGLDGKRILHEMTLGNAEARLGRSVEKTMRKAERLAMETERYIVRNPWKAAGAALLVGVVIGAAAVYRPRR